MRTLNQLDILLRTRRAKTRMLRRFMVRAAVAVVLRQNGDSHNKLQVLLMKRAENPRDRWSGHMSLPGGRMDRTDKTARMAAIRETYEEMGLQLWRKDYLGRLSDVMTMAHGSKKPMVVSPYVFKVDGNPTLKPNYEVAEVLWVPLEDLADENNRTVIHWEKAGISKRLPCAYYQGYKVWGLTLLMLDDLISALTE